MIIIKDYKIKYSIIIALFCFLCVTPTYATGPGGTTRFEEAEDAILSETTIPITHKVKEEGVITAGDKVGIRLGVDGGGGGGSSSNKSTGGGKSSGGKTDKSNTANPLEAQKAVKGNKKVKTETIISSDAQKQTVDASEINEETNKSRQEETYPEEETSKYIDDIPTDAPTAQTEHENIETLKNEENIIAETIQQRNDTMENEKATVNEETLISKVQNRDDSKSFKGKKIFLLNTGGGLGFGGEGSSKTIQFNIFAMIISSLLLIGFLRTFIGFQLQKKQSFKL